MKSVVLTVAYEPQPHWFYSRGIMTILRSSLKINQHEGRLGGSSRRTLSSFASLPSEALVLGPPKPSQRHGQGALGKLKSAPTAQSPPVAPRSLKKSMGPAPSTPLTCSGHFALLHLAQHTRQRALSAWNALPWDSMASPLPSWGGLL